MQPKFSKSTGSLSQATGNREERFALGSASCSPVRLTSWGTSPSKGPGGVASEGVALRPAADRAWRGNFLVLEFAGQSRRFCKKNGETWTLPKLQKPSPYTYPQVYSGRAPGPPVVPSPVPHTPNPTITPRPTTDLFGAHCVALACSLRLPFGWPAPSPRHRADGM